MRSFDVRVAGLLGTVAFLTTACVNLDDSPALTLWEGQLEPTAAYPDFSGQAAAVSGIAGTTVGIGIDGGAPDAEYAWSLRVGTCSAPGTQFGDDDLYPTLVPEPVTGAAEAETQLSSRLELDGSYIVEVRVSPTDPTQVACGQLVSG